MHTQPRFRKALTLLMGLLLVAVLLPARALADGTGSITLDLKDTSQRDEPWEIDGSIALWKVASFDSVNRFVIADGQFAEYETAQSIVDMTSAELDERNESLSGSLEAEAFDNAIAPADIQAIANESVTFSDLERGLYLIAQWESTAGNRTMNTFLITVPDADGNMDIQALPKQGYPDPGPSDESEGELRVKKVVNSTRESDKTKEYGFTVTLLGALSDITGTYGDMEFKDGVATFTLKDSEVKKATFKDSTGADLVVKYTVEETDPQGLTPSSTKSDDGSLVTFTNTYTPSKTEQPSSDTKSEGSSVKLRVPQTGDASLPFIAIAVVGGIAVAVGIVLSRRNKGDKS